MSWNSVKETNIENAFYKIMTLENTNIENDDQLNYSELSIKHMVSIKSEINDLKEINDEEMQEWIECYQEELGYQIIRDDDDLNNQISTAIGPNEIDDHKKSNDVNECVIKKKSSRSKGCSKRSHRIFGRTI
ncbi:hypothetical protein ABEB36_003116 [Hypothenemus hampei]|uniref:Uncharacterized protein n=1 Tax=Hypothenemus hampei TaxID=57062 RepID=A0ABD1F831_HYPHA